ncbi:MAG: hypothetical protein GX587_12095 [Bacteroidales bacterium]|nr:hypothetical protein [Bacteroidales bacterium]
MLLHSKDFFISKLRIYHGPNTYLNSRAVVFNVYLEPEGPDSNHYKEYVYSVFPHVALYNPTTVIDLFARTLQHILQFGKDIMLNDYSISEEDADYVVAIEYFDPRTSFRAVSTTARWFQSMNQRLPFSMMPEYENLKHEFEQSDYGCSSVISIISNASRLGIPLFFPFSRKEMKMGYGQNTVSAKCMHCEEKNTVSCKCHLEVSSKDAPLLNYLDPPNNLLFLLKNIFNQKKSARIPIIATNHISKEQTDYLCSWIRHINPRFNVAGATTSEVFFNQAKFTKQSEHWEDIKWVLQSKGVSFALFEHNVQSTAHSGFYHQGADLIILDTTHECPDGLYNLLEKDGILVELHKHNVIVFQNQKIIYNKAISGLGDPLDEILPFLDSFFEVLATKYLF